MLRVTSFYEVWLNFPFGVKVQPKTSIEIYKFQALLL